MYQPKCISVILIKEQGDGRILSSVRDAVAAVATTTAVHATTTQSAHNVLPEYEWRRWHFDAGQWSVVVSNNAKVVKYLPSVIAMEEERTKTKVTGVDNGYY